MEIYYRNITLLACLILALFSYGFVFILKNKFSYKRYINLCERIKTWIMIIGVLYIGSLSKVTFLGLFGVISFTCVKEFYNIFQIKYYRNTMIYSAIIICINYFLIYKNCLGLYLLFIPVILLVFGYFLKEKKEMCISIFISAYLISFITYLINKTFGIKEIILYIMIIELNDIYQYITGSILGKTKIVPKISPNKTLEGVLGGILLTTLTIILMKSFYWKELHVWSGIIISILGFCGDIFISHFKRRYNIKDSGTFLKGHGGILDRVDSLVFNSPFIFLMVYMYGK
ncbi:phosphatidate cytidylyltransferase [Fusobacterium sp. PH5-44]|uniref:phosphatidate cytidylyltransferase n=1 Tax=unclassified Fusobacterium TaxID=2648384 RepID=UPI003D25B64B